MDIQKLADGAGSVMKKLPKVYDDAAQPFAKQIGKAGKTVGQFVNVVLSPLALSVYAYQQAEPAIKDKISKKITAKLKKIPPNKLIAPAPRIAIPALQSFVHAAGDEEIAEMFANLLASAMNVDEATNVHPSFVEIINSLTSDEAKVLKLFSKGIAQPLLEVRFHSPPENSGYSILKDNFSLIGQVAELKRSDLTPSYINNLQRLGLLEVPSNIRITGEENYKELEEHPDILQIKKELEGREGYKVTTHQKLAKLTAFGLQFSLVCLSKEK